MDRSLVDYYLEPWLVSCRSVVVDNGHSLHASARTKFLTKEQNSVTSVCAFPWHSLRYKLHSSYKLMITYPPSRDIFRQQNTVSLFVENRGLRKIETLLNTFWKLSNNITILIQKKRQFVFLKFWPCNEQQVLPSQDLGNMPNDKFVHWPTSRARHAGCIWFFGQLLSLVVYWPISPFLPPRNSRIY